MSIETKEAEKTLSETEQLKIIRELDKKLPELLGLKSKEDALAKSIESLTDKQKMKLLSYLALDEIEEMAILLNIAEDYDLSRLKRYVYNFLQLRCSFQGLRASQLVDIAKEKQAEHRRTFLGIFRRKEKKPPLGEVELVE